MDGLSIIVTYYKGESFIFKCLDSIFQSYDKSNKILQNEVVLIIDSMGDAERIEGLLKEKYDARPLRILKNAKNLGVSASRNVALNEIRYQFYTVIDQDDYVKEDYFSVLEKELDSNTAIHIINGTILYIGNNIEVPIYFFAPKFSFRSLILKNTFIYTPGLLILNSKFVAPNNLFIDTSEQYKGCDDWAAYLNLLIDLNDSVSQKYISTPLFVYCLHSTNYSNNKGEMINSSIAVLDYLQQKTQLNKTNAEDIKVAHTMQKFYYAKDVDLLKKTALLKAYPAGFSSHYFLSFFNKERMNRLIFRLAYLKKRITG